LEKAKGKSTVEEVKDDDYLKILIIIAHMRNNMTAYNSGGGNRGKGKNVFKKKEGEE